MIRKIGIASFVCAVLYNSVMPVSAQGTVPSKPTWRCGNSYSDQPCVGGKTIDVSDPRSASDRLAADAATQRESSSAAAMERERLRLERAAVARDRVNATINARAKAERDWANLPPAPYLQSRRLHSRRLAPPYFTARGENTLAKKPADASSK